jgi:hypothetical protein
MKQQISQVALIEVNVRRARTQELPRASMRLDRCIAAMQAPRFSAAERAVERPLQKLKDHKRGKAHPDA